MKKYIPRSDLVETKYKKGSKDNNIVTLFILSLDSILKIQEKYLRIRQFEDNLACAIKFIFQSKII